MEAVDIAVVGAGPAGSAAAITAARRGRSVIVVDRARFPRDKCCGDGLTTGALRELERLGLAAESIASWHDVGATWIRSPSGRTVEFPLPEGRGRFAAVARRIDLDNALMEKARHEGAKIVDGHAVTHVDTSDPRHVRLSLSDADPIVAGAVIAADGMWSPVRRMLGLTEPDNLGQWHAFRQYFTRVTGSAAERMWVWFEPDLLPGYAWSFPLGGGVANVGFGVMRGSTPTGHMKTLWPDLLERPHIVDALGPTAQAEAPHRAWPIPACIDHAVLGRGRVVFAGDAAAASDCLTGEGIGQALLTGRLAAEALLMTTRPEARLAAYERAVTRALFADHRMSVLLGRVLSADWGARGAVRLAGLTPWTRRKFARWMFEDEPRAAAFTPRRWHREFLDRSGAAI
jgi:menaquinone-9 beta-reductase